jgi:hypothetical protein
MDKQLARIDDEAMATDFVPGARTYAYLAMKYGLTLAAVGEIVSTWRPPALPWTLEEARETALGRAELRLMGLLETAVEVLAAGVGGGATRPAMTAAKQILDRVLGPPGHGGGRGSGQAGRADLPGAAHVGGRAYVRLNELSPDTLQMVARDMIAREKEQNAMSEGGKRDESNAFGPTSGRRQGCRGNPAREQGAPSVRAGQSMSAGTVAQSPAPAQPMAVPPLRLVPREEPQAHGRVEAASQLPARRVSPPDRGHQRPQARLGLGQARGREPPRG